MRVLLIVLLCHLTVSALEHQPFQGGIAVLKLDGFKSKPKLFYKASEAKVVKRDGEFFAVIGIGVDEKVGRRHIVAVDGVKKIDLYFEILPKEYEKEYITLKSSKHVSLSAKNLARHQSEREKSRELFLSFNKNIESDLEFVLPLKGRVSSPFGKKRYYNNKPRSPHKGVDIAAPQGSDIVATQRGLVAISEEFFFNGNTIYIDHGEGVVSMYCHMEKLLVKAGEMVERGQVIGTVGETGRATGPHLHFGLFLNTKAVDPSVFIDNL